ncbi:hypothetical protein [Pelobium manganitolerans]
MSLRTREIHQYLTILWRDAKLTPYPFKPTSYTLSVTLNPTPYPLTLF